jgi:diadenylate cyclase
MLDLDFLPFGIFAIIDIVLVAVLMYLLYKLVKGSIAFNIFLGFLSLYLFSLLVELLNMQLLSTIFKQFMGIGVLALLIVFQQEIRRFLLLVGKNSPLFNNPQSLKNILLFNWKRHEPLELNIDAIIEACKRLSRDQVGALIVIARTSELKFYASTGTSINAKISHKLLESIFQKNSPLHDGATIIAKNTIRSASCVLPLSESDSIPGRLGMRHRAAMGISEQTDATAIVVSEETGRISLMHEGRMKYNISIDELRELLNLEFVDIKDE